MYKKILALFSEVVGLSGNISENEKRILEILGEILLLKRTNTVLKHLISDFAKNANHATLANIETFLFPEKEDIMIRPHVTSRGTILNRRFFPSMGADQLLVSKKEPDNVIVDFVREINEDRPIKKIPHNVFERLNLTPTADILRDDTDTNLVLDPSPFEEEEEEEEFYDNERDEDEDGENEEDEDDEETDIDAMPQLPDIDAMPQLPDIDAMPQLPAEPAQEQEVLVASEPSYSFTPTAQPQFTYINYSNPPFSFNYNIIPDNNEFEYSHELRDINDWIQRYRTRYINQASSSSTATSTVSPTEYPANE